MAERKINLAVLISGGGSNLQALIDACENPDYPARIAVVISNIPDAYGLERARNAGIITQTINHKDFDAREEFEVAMTETLSGHAIDLICLAGFMRIFTPEFTKQWEGRMINVHPSLLPRHGGEGMYGMHVHKAVLDCGDAESGASVHHVIADVDAGEVIVQRTVAVSADDTVDSLAAKVLEQEHIAYPEAIERLAKEILSL